MTQSPDGHERRIVVGVDGSAASKAALAWAIGQAAMTGAVVQAVMAYYWFPVPMEELDFKGLATHLLDDAILDASSVGPPVKIISSVVHGNPAKVLLNAARGADLLVVGNRGHGGFTGALLGSVSQQCVHHADCPVVIIRHLRTKAIDPVGARQRGVARVAPCDSGALSSLA